MNIMVIGSGGREHAIIKKIKENKNADKIYAIPGNGGIAADAECVNIGAKDIDKIVEHFGISIERASNLVQQLIKEGLFEKYVL